MKKFLASVGYALNGVIAAFREQSNLKIQSAFGLLAIAAGLYYGISLVEWMVLILTMTLVLSLELINTAIENFVDLVSPEKRPLAGKIKDVAAGAVFVAAIGSLIVGVLIFVKYV
jgi:diacylglycerol kinase